jgi:hypothetical protein
MDRRSSPTAIAGAVLALIGALMLGGLAVIAYGQAPALEHAYFQLGLALPSLLAGLALTLVMAGVWMLFSGARRR